jgi:hypothetical protein
VPRGAPEGILDDAGDSPPVLASRGYRLDELVDVDSLGVVDILGNEPQSTIARARLNG